AYGQELITQRGVFGVIAGHQNRHLAIDPKTGALFVGVGSAGNIGVEPEVKASIQRFEPDGSGQTTFASGMRNPTTLAFHPTTGELYAGVQERDGLGDNLRPIISLASRRVRFTVGPTPISVPILNRALHIGRRKKSKRPWFQNSRQSIAGM